jgi:hypothetical protein
MLDQAVYTSVSEIADAEGINRSYLSRVLRLTLLAPKIVERIMEDRNPPGLAELLRPFPMEWEKQREFLLRSRENRSGGTPAARHPAEELQQPCADPSRARMYPQWPSRDGR